MREMRIEGVRCRRFRGSTTRREAGAKPAPDLVNYDFSANWPNRLWVVDVTYLPSSARWLFLAAVVDVWSRRVVSWSMARQMRTQLVRDALTMAVTSRQPKYGLVHRSDRGSQYTSTGFGELGRTVGIRQSMGSGVGAPDNALCDGFFATIETELTECRRFGTQAEARREVSGSVEGFYNTRRSHSALDCSSPADFESTTVRPEAVSQERGEGGGCLVLLGRRTIKAPRRHTTPHREEGKKDGKRRLGDQRVHGPSEPVGLNVT